MLATHPPILERIKRIDPAFDGTLPPAGELPTPTYREEPAVAAAGFAPNLPSSSEAIARARRAMEPSHVVGRAGAPTPASVATADRVLKSIPRDVAEAARDPYSARAVVFALVISRDAAVRAQQLAQVAAALNPAAQRELIALTDEVNRLHPATRLPLLDLSLPALRRMSPPQIAQFRTLVRALVEADRQVSLFEYALLRILDQHLRSPDAPARRGPVQYYAINAVRDEAVIVLSALASASETDAEQAFAAGARRLDPENPPAFVRSASLSAVDDALARLVAASPAVKQRVIDACAHVVASDGQVSVDEAELLRAVASTMDVPLPPLFAAGHDAPVNLSTSSGSHTL